MTTVMDECPQCGGPKTGYADVCRACIKDEAEWRGSLIRRRWLAGRSLREIAREVGCSAGSVAVSISVMRSKGFDLPYRDYRDRKRAY